MAGMSQGTEPTPPQLRLSYSHAFADNMFTASKDLRRQGVSVSTIQQFEKAAYELWVKSPESGQIDAFAKGAAAGGFELHWIN